MSAAQVMPSSVVQMRSVVLVTPDADLRQRLTERLAGMRWRVLPAAGGAEAMVHLGDAAPEAMIVDHWLPDLDAAEFAHYAAAMCPGTDLLGMDGSANAHGHRCARRNELLHALREAQEECVPAVAAVHDAAGDGAAWLHAPVTVPHVLETPRPASAESLAAADPSCAADPSRVVEPSRSADSWLKTAVSMPAACAAPVDVRMHLPEMVGDSLPMREMAELIRLVAPHTACVLIQGETGTGKELVAKAVHRLSLRAGKPFAVLNCAAIPEHLLEAELFGHTRGAFTGAVTSRTGRIEAAHGGTLFLDEIGEMPLPLQAKMLRFLENGEIQRVGDNDVSRVDVRIVAATHQHLERNAAEKTFRLDLYHRLAVFPVDVPALRERREDIPMLVEHLLRRLGETSPRKSILPEALALLMGDEWPGNVRQLSHVLQRAAIVAGEASAIASQHLRLPRALRDG